MPTTDKSYYKFYDPYIEGFKGVFIYKILGIYLIKIYPLLFGLSLSIYKRVNALTLILLIISAILIVLSFHRTSTFMFIFMNFLILFAYRDYWKKIFKISLILLSSFFLILFLTPNISEKLIGKTVDQLFENNKFQIYPNHYIGHYKTALNMIEKNLITGVGTDSFSTNCSAKEFVYFYDSFIDEDSNIIYLNSCSTHPHNFYLQIFSENGVFAFTILLLFYFFILNEFKLIVLSKKYYSDHLYKFCIISTICIYFPFAPSVSFYNTYLSSLNYFSVIFIIFYKLKLKYNLFKL